MEKLPLVLDLTGTFVFALSGALAGVKRALDLFGVLVLSFAAANSGGIARDLLIGVVPPGAVGDWRYLGVSLFAGLITFYFSAWIVRMSNSVLIFDAAGLALFAVTGASKALTHGLHPVMAKNHPLNESFDESLRRIYYDTVIHSKDSLAMLIKLARPPREQDLLTLARDMREHGRNAIWVASDLLRGEKS